MVIHLGFTPQLLKLLLTPAIKASQFLARLQPIDQAIDFAEFETDQLFGRRPSGFCLSLAFLGRHSEGNGKHDDNGECHDAHGHQHPVSLTPLHVTATQAVERNIQDSG